MATAKPKLLFRPTACPPHPSVQPLTIKNTLGHGGQFSPCFRSSDGTTCGSATAKRYFDNSNNDLIYSSIPCISDKTQVIGSKSQIQPKPKPKPSMPDIPMPNTTMHGASISKPIKPELKMPKATIAKTTMPELMMARTKMPKTAISESTTPKKVTPKTRLPQITMPKAIPEKTISEKTTSEIPKPETKLPDLKNVKAVVPSHKVAPKPKPKDRPLPFHLTIKSQRKRKVAKFEKAINTHRSLYTMYGALADPFPDIENNYMLQVPSPKIIAKLRLNKPGHAKSAITDDLVKAPPAKDTKTAVKDTRSPLVNSLKAPPPKTKPAVSVRSVNAPKSKVSATGQTGVKTAATARADGTKTAVTLNTTDNSKSKDSTTMKSPAINKSVTPPRVINAVGGVASETNSDKNAKPAASQTKVSPSTKKGAAKK